MSKLKAKCRFSENNRGSGIVTVLVAVVFISALAAILMNMSYTAVLMRVTEQKGATNFYDAAEIMDQIQAGFQVAVADSVTIAYDDVLKDYGSEEKDADGNTMSLEERFKESFKHEFLNWEIGTGVTALKLSGGTTPNYTYSNLAIAQFLKEAGVPEEDFVINAATDDEKKKPIQVTTENTMSAKEDCYIFEGITVSYTNAATEFSTVISADIQVNVPNFSMTQTEGLGFVAVPNFALIADGELNNTVRTEMIIDGSAYAGSVHLAKNGKTIITNGRLICKENVDIKNSHTLNVQEKGEIWAENIKLENKAMFNLNGEAYVADDLNLGDETKAKLNNRYYGFGTGKETTDGEYSSALSSSIIVNGSDATLDLENSKHLMLAGNSFINNGENSSVLTGESISIRPNQLAYLVPMSVLAELDVGITSNPHILSDSAAAPAVSTYGDKILLGKKTFNDYKAEIKPLYYQLGAGTGAKAVYYFLNFKAPADANQYFKDYFASDANVIEEYLQLSVYASAISNPQGSVETSGYYIEHAMNASGETKDLVIAENIAGLSEESIAFANLTRTNYNYLCKNLTTMESAVGMTPYKSIVEDGDMSKFTGTGTWEFKNAEGEIVALLVGSHFTLGNSDQYKNVNLILTKDGNINVTIKRIFDGLVVASGDIKIGIGASKVTASQSLVQDAFDAVCNVNGEDIPFRTLISDSSETHVGSTGTVGAWDISDAVEYKNWKKD